VKPALALLSLAVLASVAHADDDTGAGTIVFARGGALYRVDSRGRGETQLADLPAGSSVRALRADASGKVLLVDLGASWAWLPLDGSSASLDPLPCGEGPAQLTEDGVGVLCRAKGAPGSILVELNPRKVFSLAAAGPSVLHISGAAGARSLVWADATGVWRAPVADPRKKALAAADAPLRGFSTSPDGERALGIFADTVYTDAHHTKPLEQLESFALDGKATRRKSIKDGIAVDWSHDSAWVLVQEGPKACLMRAVGGEYKCWKGYTAASLSPDGRWGLLLGNRAADKPKDPPRGKHRPAPPPRPPSSEPEEATPDSSDEPPDTAIPPPTGPLSLYRARLEGAFTDPPALLVKVVDGAAVWIPAPP
jgi:hypothetical protein